MDTAFHCCMAMWTHHCSRCCNAHISSDSFSIHQVTIVKKWHSSFPVIPRASSTVGTKEYDEGRRLDFSYFQSSTSITTAPGSITARDTWEKARVSKQVTSLCKDFATFPQDKWSMISGHLQPDLESPEGSGWQGTFVDSKDLEQHHSTMHNKGDSPYCNNNSDYEFHMYWPKLHNQSIVRPTQANTKTATPIALLLKHRPRAAMWRALSQALDAECNAAKRREGARSII